MTPASPTRHFFSRRNYTVFSLGFLLALSAFFNVFYVNRLSSLQTSFNKQYLKTDSLYSVRLDLESQVARAQTELERLRKQMPAGDSRHDMEKKNPEPKTRGKSKAGNSTATGTTGSLQHRTIMNNL
jgi:hypothetical protein